MRADCPRHGKTAMTQVGDVRWCERCAWEDPANPRDIPAPPAEEKKPAIESIGTKDLARMCSARITEVEEALKAATRKFREQEQAAREEMARLRKIVAFCGGTPPSGGVRGQWACPACGHQTRSRWKQRHIEQCPAQAS